MQEITIAKLIGSSLVAFVQVWYISMLYKATTFMPPASEVLSGNSKGTMGFMLGFRHIYENLTPFLLASINLMTSKGIAFVILGEEVLFYLTDPKDPNLYLHVGRMLIILIIHVGVTFINFGFFSRTVSKITEVKNLEMYDESVKTIEKLKRIATLSDAYEEARVKNTDYNEIVQVLEEKRKADITKILFYSQKKTAPEYFNKREYRGF